MLKVYVDRADEFFAIEKRADGHFNAGNATLQLKYLNFIRESLLVGFEHADDILAIFLFANEETTLYVLRFAAGFNHVAVRIFGNKLDRGVKRIEIFVGDDVDAGLL